MSDPHIEIKHPSEVIFQDLAHIYRMEDSPLDMPKDIAIGKYYGRERIESYADQVIAYSDNLNAEIKMGNQVIMAELEKIYDLAQGAGVILTTICMPCPYVTHAHVVKDIIMELASGH